MSEEPRPWTEEEIRAHFLDHCASCLEYWLNEARAKGTRTKMEGLLFSVLAGLDGCSNLPAFKLIPNPHPKDKEFHQSEGDNWYPEDVDIGGFLHELIHKHLRR